MDNLSPEEFEGLLNRLGPDRDQAAEEYELLRRKLVRFFERNQCAGTDALADETIDRVARRLEIDEIRDINLFSFGVARIVHLESRRKAARVVSINEDPGGEILLSDRLDLEASMVEQITQAEGLGCLEKCLGNLAEDDHALILEYYIGEKHSRIKQRQDLALKRGVGVKTLRNRANSVREKLRRCVFACLKKALRQTYSG
jgi:DNA-directed RNA polymerase specialized sigma24 family protein